MFLFFDILIKQTNDRKMHFKCLPIRREEKDPFMVGLDSTIIATMFPTRPKTDTAVKRTPSMMKPKVEVRTAAEAPSPEGLT